jgi:hypothetical protein
MYPQRDGAVLPRELFFLARFGAFAVGIGGVPVSVGRMLVGPS